MDNVESKYYSNIIIPSNKGNSLVISYEGSDLCLRCIDYEKGNVFYVLRDNQMYIPMKMLFKELRKNDKFCYVNKKELGTKFEWISDGHNYASQNRLVIIETHEGFRIQFLKNPYNDNEKE